MSTERCAYCIEQVFKVCFIFATILAAILDSGNRIATPTSGMVLQPLIPPYTVVLGDPLVHLHWTLKNLAAILADILAAIFGFWWPDCKTNFRNGFASLDNPYKIVLGDSLVHLD